KKAWAMRHQLCTTLPSRLYSCQRRPNALSTPIGRGRVNGGRISQWVSTNQAAMMRPQLRKERASRVRGVTSLRISNRFAISMSRGVLRGRIGINLYIRAAILLAALSSVVSVDRPVRAVAHRAHARRRVPILLHQVLF